MGDRQRVAVVGAGLAGLTCAWRLRQAGHRVRVYEASDRVGGRCWTLRGRFADAQHVERGGQYIDSGHATMRALVAELGLELVDVEAAEPDDLQPFLVIGGERYPVGEAAADLAEALPVVQADLRAAGYPTLHHRWTPFARELDRLSITEYLERLLPDGADGRSGRLLQAAYAFEYGADADDLSALNLLHLLGFADPDRPALFGPADGRYEVLGGADLVPSRLAERLDDDIATGHELVALAQLDDAVRLTFQHGSSTRETTVDKAVLALPFAVLRERVDASRAGFSARKRRAIATLGMGATTKLHLQFAARHWLERGSNGARFTDGPDQSTWDETMAQPGVCGVLVSARSGDAARAGGDLPAGERAARFLRGLEPLLPGITACWNGIATYDDWPRHPWARGSYAYYRVGQYTDIAGVEREPEGGWHFAGEHTAVGSVAATGMNGAVESGERAAREVLRVLGRAASVV